MKIKKGRGMKVVINQSTQIPDIKMGGTVQHLASLRSVNDVNVPPGSPEDTVLVYDPATGEFYFETIQIVDGGTF